jgi:hypothetical protein
MQPPLDFVSRVIILTLRNAGYVYSDGADLTCDSYLYICVVSCAHVPLCRLDRESDKDWLLTILSTAFDEPGNPKALRRYLNSGVRTPRIS